MGMIGVYFVADDDLVDKICINNDILFDKKYDEYYFDLDKSWALIDFIMKNNFKEYKTLKNAVINDNILFGGEYDEPIDMGYTPLFITEYEDVKLIHDIVKDIDIEFFRSKYNFNELLEKEIYPLSKYNNDDEEDDYFEYIYQNFDKLKNAFKLAYEKNSNILFFVW